MECLEKKLENKITLSKNVIAKKIDNNIRIFIAVNPGSNATHPVYKI